MGLRGFTVQSLVNVVWRCFISLKLTFVLLAVISLGAVLGMSFDQTKSFEEFYQVQQDHSLVRHLTSFFELYDAFHSWWFSLAILLLSLNLIACSIERLPRIYFDFMRPRPYLTKRRRMGLQLVASAFVSSEADAEKLVSRFLPSTPQKAALKHPGYFYAERHSMGRFGVYVVHIALLVIMFSSIYATQNGVDGHIQIEEGQKARFVTARGPSGISYDYDLGFYVGCDDFRLRTFIDNSPMEYESDLYISHGDEPIIKKTVRVNEPLSYRGFTLYQSSFRPVISERVVTLAIAGVGFKESVAVKLNQPIPLPNGDTIEVAKIYEDFAGLGQAIRVLQKSPDKTSTYFHVFRRYQDYDSIVRASPFSVAFTGADQRYVTGLSVGYVPGIFIIFSGFLLLMLGLYLCFFTNPMRFFARIEPAHQGFTVWFAAQGFRHHYQVKDVFVKRLPAESIHNV